MATTWIKPLHIRKDRTLYQSIFGRTHYAMNQEKMQGGVPVIGYACDPRTVDEEFLLSKKEYEYLTGRDNGNKNVIAYHIRQSFKPGEVTPEEAQEAGYELAMRFTKGKHAFIVAVHTDTKHIHCAIVFNSTALDCKKKFNNSYFSSFAVRRLSDLICAERGLYVIENPKPSKGQNYAKWLGDKEPSWQDKLRGKIDEILPGCSTFEEFLTALKNAGYKVNQNRKHISVVAPGQKRPSRLNTLKGDHTEAAIKERIAGTRIVTSSSGGRIISEPINTAPITSLYNVGTGQPRVSLLVDIQAKIREGKGEGYERWARIFNLKEAAKTLIFLQENGIDSYEDLVKKASSASGNFSALSKKIKDTEKRLSDITELQKHIGTYGKTRDTFAKYKASGYDKDFYESQRADITLHRAAKKYFDGLGLRKLPTIAELKKEYAELLAEKKKLYSGYRAAKNNMRELAIAKDNATKILGISSQAQETQRHDAERQQQKSITHEK